jgi:hypothetical protein
VLPGSPGETYFRETARAKLRGIPSGWLPQSALAGCGHGPLQVFVYLPASGLRGFVQGTLGRPGMPALAQKCSFQLLARHPLLVVPAHMDRDDLVAVNKTVLHWMAWDSRVDWSRPR